MNEILFVPINSRDSEMFIPIIRRLEEKPGILCPVISLDTYNKQNSEELFLKNNIPFTRIDEYQTKNVNDIVKRERPDLIIVTNDQSMIERSFVLAGNHLNIPTLYLQNGAIGKMDYSKKDFMVRYLFTIKHSWDILNRYMFYFLTLKSIENGYYISIKKFINDLWKNATKIELRGQYGCSLIATTGIYEKELFMNSGVPEDRILPIGNPKFDSIVNNNYNAEEVRKNYNIPEDKKIILLTTQAMVEHGHWTEKQRELFAKSIIDVFSNMPELHLLIKHHPMEPIDVYRKIVKDSPDNVTLCENANLYELINSCEILITLLSTTALEAMIFNRVVIIVNLFGDPSSLPYGKSGAAIEVEDIKELPSAISNGLKDKRLQNELAINREKFLLKHAYKTDGKTLDRIVDLISSIIS